MAAAAQEERITKQGAADEQVDWSCAGNQRSCSRRGGQPAGKGSPIGCPIDERGEEGRYSVAVGAAWVSSAVMGSAGCVSRTASSRRWRMSSGTSRPVQRLNAAAV